MLHRRNHWYSPGYMLEDEHSLCFDINSLAVLFNSCKFVWVMREAKMVAMSLQNLLLLFSVILFAFKKLSLPLFWKHVREMYMGVLLFLLNEIS